MAFNTSGVDSFVVQLAVSAARTLAVAATAGVALYLFRAKSPSLRLHAWRWVLYLALAMPGLTLMLPSLGVPIPRVVVPGAAPTSRTGPLGSVERHPKDMKASIASTDRERTAYTPQSAPRYADSPGLAERSLYWKEIVSALYLAIMLFLLLRIGVGLAFAVGLARSSSEITDPELSRLADLAQRYKVNTVPRIFESGSICVPLTMGILHPLVLLPANWREWSDAKLDAVLEHEVSHIARHDALTHMLSLLHRAIFWFSPLAWWLHRHLEGLAEQASDEAALSSGADRHEYARALMEFLESVHASHGRIRWQVVSMAKGGPSEERIQNILAWKGAVTMTLKKSAAIGIVAIVVPVVYVAASAHAVIRNDKVAYAISQQQHAVQASAQPAASSSQVAPAVTEEPMDGASASAVAPVASAVLSGQANSSSGGGYSAAYGNDDDDLRFVIVSGKSDAVTMSGSSGDARHAENLKKKIPGDFIWFQIDEKSYIIRDQSTIDRARKLWAPQEDLSQKQEALGKQQEELGKRQEALGTKMEQVRVNIPDMTATLDQLKAKLQKLGSSATMDQVGDLQSEIGELQSKIGDLQSQAGDQQSKFGEQQAELGEQQAKLGAEQAKLGEQQAAIADQANVHMKSLLDDAIKNGTAKPESDGGGASL